MERDSHFNRILSIVLLIVVHGIMLVSCSGNLRKENIIIVTIPPQKALVEELASPYFVIHCMVSNGNSPEDYDPTPQDLAIVSKAKAYFLIGELGFEKAWSMRLKQNNSQMKLFNSSQGINFTTGEHHHTSHSHERRDPHVWTSPKQLYKIAENTANFLISLDSIHRDIYLQRFQILLAKIDKVDSLVRESTQNLPTKSFAIYHPSLSYFARDYGLEQISLEEDGKEPSARHLFEIQKELHEHSVQVVFIQQEFDSKNAELLAQENHCKVVTINPLNPDWQREILSICKALQ